VTPKRRSQVKVVFSVYSTDAAKVIPLFASWCVDDNAVCTTHHCAVHAMMVVWLLQYSV